MNDFTKEDLEYIDEAICLLIKLGWYKSDMHFSRKLQFMINSYQQKECDKFENLKAIK